jgi:MFS family permease
LVSSIPMMSELYPPARATMLSLNIAGMAVGRAVGAQMSPLLYEIGMAKFVLFSGLGLVILGSIVLDFFAILALKVIPHESVLADEQVRFP